MIKSLMLAVGCVLVWSGSLQAQIQPRSAVISGATLPSACGVGDVYVKTGGSAGWYICLASNMWVAVGGGAGADISGSSTTEMLFNNAGDIDGFGSWDPVNGFIVTTTAADTAASSATSIEAFAFTAGMGAANNPSSITAAYASARSFLPTGRTLSGMDGVNGQVEHGDAGTVTNARAHYGQIDNWGGGVITNGYGGMDAWVYSYTDGSTYGKGYFYSGRLSGGALASIGELYGVWFNDFGDGTSTHPYYSWFDSRGVGRCKEDNTFDMVGQVICGVYNPQVTKYTPTEANYERIIYGQWNGNVAEIGTEKGGTGTLRDLRLLGTSILMPALATTGAATGKTVVCADSDGRLFRSSTGTDCSN